MLLLDYNDTGEIRMKYITMFKLGKDGERIHQVVIPDELKSDLEGVGFVDHVDKVADDSIEDAVIIEEKPKKKRAPRKPKVTKDA